MATSLALKRQIITDVEGNPIAVILPIEEFALIQDLLNQHTGTKAETDKLAQMKRAARDPLFLADLRETMSAFAKVDAQWWEPEQ